MRYLGLDLGSRTLGVAVSDKTGLIASNLEIIRHNEEYDRLVFDVQKLVDELEIDEIVLGYPKNMDGSEGEKALLSKDFKEKLSKVIDKPIHLQDERLTTKSATDILIQGDVSRKNRKKVIDSVAASIILQTFLDRRNK